MTRSIWIDNIPDSLYQTLSARAAAEGQSLSDYLRAEVERIAKRAPVWDVLERASRRADGADVESIVAAVRTGRDLT